MKEGEFITIAFHKVNLFLNSDGVSFFFSHPVGFDLKTVYPTDEEKNAYYNED